MATIANYVLVEQTTEYEYKSSWQVSSSGQTQTWTSIRLRRAVTRMTWEATLDDSSSAVPSAQNPGNLSTVTWKLESVSYSRTLSAPLSKHIRETWTSKGEWENAE